VKDITKEKKDTLERMLEDEHALAHIAPQVPGVELPEHLRGGPTVTLKLSRYFRGHLTISDSTVESELLFGERYFTCKIPFVAIWGMTSMRGQFLMWPESAPAEVLATLEQQAQARKADALAAQADAAEPSAGDPRSAETHSATESKPRPKLRRVK